MPVLFQAWPQARKAALPPLPEPSSKPVVARLPVQMPRAALPASQLQPQQAEQQQQLALPQPERQAASPQLDQPVASKRWPVFVAEAAQ